MKYHFDKASVLVVGDVMLDRSWYGTTERTSPEAPVPIVNIQDLDDRPGGAGNAALNITALEGKCTLIAIVGEDESGQKLERLLEHYGVESQLRHSPQYQTITKLRVLSQQQQLIRLDFECHYADFPKQKLLAAYREHIEKNAVIILSDYNKGTLCDISLLIQMAKEQNKMVLVDPGGDFNRYQNATIITPNLKEFKAFVGDCPNEEILTEKAHQLILQLNLNALLLTRGENGMTLFQLNEKPLHLPSPNKEIYDVTGAGDTVIAVLGLALAANYDLHTACRLANTAAGLVVNKLGASTVSVQELNKGMQQRRMNMDIPKGLVSLSDLNNAVDCARALGDKIVMTNGCFDLLHAGHVDFLIEAKKRGDRLFVAINDDNSIRRIKGESRPILPLHTRAKMLGALAAVDWVVAFSEDTPHEVIKTIKPDLLVKGGDYDVSQVVGAEVVYEYGGEVQVVPHDFMECSTTNIIEKIKMRDGEE